MSDDEDTHDQSYTEDIDFLPVNILDDGEYICADAQPTGPSSPYFSNDTFSSPTGKPQSAAGEREGGSCVRLPSCHVPAPCYAGWKDLAVLRVDSCCFGTCHCVISFPPQIARSSLGGTFDKQWSQSGTCIYIYIYLPSLYLPTLLRFFASFSRYAKHRVCQICNRSGPTTVLILILFLPSNRT